MRLGVVKLNFITSGVLSKQNLCYIIYRAVREILNEMFLTTLEPFLPKHRRPLPRISFLIINWHNYSI